MGVIFSGLALFIARSIHEVRLAFHYTSPIAREFGLTPLPRPQEISTAVHSRR